MQLHFCGGAVVEYLQHLGFGERVLLHMLKELDHSLLFLHRRLRCRNVAQHLCKYKYI